MTILGDMDLTAYDLGILFSSTQEEIDISTASDFNTLNTSLIILLACEHPASIRLLA